MYVLALAKTKGGTGSTTLAACLAVEASQRGKRVGILDADPQRALERWWHTREGEAELDLGDRPLELVKHKRHLDETFAAALVDDYDVLIIDGPPGAVGTTKMIVEIADFILIACQPSPLDLGAMDAVVDITRQSRKPYAFILTRTKPRAVATTGAREFLTGNDLGEVLEDCEGLLEVRDRTNYAAAMLRGATLPEVEPKGEGPREIARLWEQVETRLRKAHRSTAKARVAP
jgi:chromosome partitioning protein